MNTPTTPPTPDSPFTPEPPEPTEPRDSLADEMFVDDGRTTPLPTTDAPATATGATTR